MLLPSPEQYATWQEFGNALLQVLEADEVNTPIQLAQYAIEQLPQANQDGLVVFVLNDINGAQPAYSYNGEWLVFGDNTPTNIGVFSVDFGAEFG